MGPRAGPGSALRRVRRRLASSLRYKLIALVLLPIVLVAPAVVVFVVYWSQAHSHEQLLGRASADLVVTHDAFVRIQRDLLSDLEHLAASYGFLVALSSGDRARVLEQVAALRDTTGFDFLHVTDLQGRWSLRAGGEEYGASPRTPLQQEVSSWGIPSVGLEIYGPGALLTEGLDVQRGARMALSGAGERTEEDRALVIRAVAPVRDRAGSVFALLDGGAILNRRAGLVDRLRGLVYGPDSLPEGSEGVASVFLDDIRIATTLRLRDGSAALGTRVSEDVRRRVLAGGSTWVGRARVLGEWYLAAYEPLIDGYGRRVGMLATGFREAPFTEAFRRTLLISLLMVALGAVLAAWLAVRGARSIFRPIESIADVVRAVKGGEERRIGALPVQDEIGELGRQFDEMLDLVRLRNAQVQAAAEQLEQQVEERTRELQAKNVRLEATIALLEEARQRLVSAEKLAALGELTAGVAHEINNPLAVIQGNLEVMRAALGAHAAEVDTEVDLVIEQVDRIRTIVDKLLSYSRTSRWDTTPQDVHLPALVADTLVLVEQAAGARAVEIQVVDEGPPTVRLDPQDLRQVLVNLLTNAMHASEPGSRVRVEMGTAPDGAAVVRVADQGAGIAPEHLGRVFDPFFTTRGEGGTGLGLSVSYGLVRRHGGEITVTSAPGRGAVFEVRLPVAPSARGSGPARAAASRGIP